MTNPLLLLDVDGVLSPYRADVAPEGYETYHINPRGTTFKVYLNPSHGEKLLSLGYDLVWATSWEDDANKLISPKVGLPDLPVIHFPTSYRTSDWHLYFKTETILNYTVNNGRPYVWIDDEISKYDTEFLALNSRVPCATLQVDPERGLTEEDFEKLREIRADLMDAQIALEGPESHPEGLTDPSGYGSLPPVTDLVTEALGALANPTRVRV